MKRNHFLRGALCAGIVCLLPTAKAADAEKQQQPVLEEFASFPKMQVTGVTVSRAGRVFVNFPFWSDDHTISVAEVTQGGQPTPYPDAAWNAKDGPPEGRFVCVQSVYVDDTEMLWVLDPASPKTEAVVPGGPKLVKIDLTSNKVVQTIPFEEDVAPERSYLNDVRVDTKTGTAYITESGIGSIIVVDLASGKKRRLLADHASTKKDPDKHVMVDGFEVIDPKTRTAPQFQADGIALDRENGYLYYHALAGRTMYRIKTEYLRDEKLKPEELADKVEKLAETPSPDGMLAGRDGTIYLAAFEEDAIARYDVGSKKTATVVADPRLQWPDTMAWGPDGMIYVTTSQIHRMPKYHGGVSKQEEPYRIFRFRP